MTKLETRRTLKTELPQLAIVGLGRAGGSIARAARTAGIEVHPAGRDDVLDACRRSEAALICVPDSSLEQVAGVVAAAIPPLQLVGHVSGASGLDVLSAAAGAGAATFSLHPLQTLPDGESELRGAACAVSGSGPEAVAFAADLGRALGMRPFAISDADRAAYHAAAAIASNSLVALAESASDLLARIGIDDARELLAPLVVRSAANWTRSGAEALTGPIARGDEATVERHREAIEAVAPDLLELYDALAQRTRAIATGPLGADAGADRRRPTLVRNKRELRAALAPARLAERSIGLVPTMGALHEGHLSLLRAARERTDVVVMSLFVNPAQFGPGEDLDAYPRDEARDLELAAREGVDVVYAPPEHEVYPEGFATAVEVGGPLTQALEGDPAQRGPEHFRGVATVVAKLLNSVGPDVAFFGQKDAQQALVIKRMVRDLDLPVEVAVLPTVREPDGLALSSRNAYLDRDERERATALRRALAAAERAAAKGAETAAALAAARAELERAGVEPDYLEARDAETLSPAPTFNGRPILVAVAARVGRARLIDNTVIHTRSEAST